MHSRGRLGRLRNGNCFKTTPSSTVSRILTCTVPPTNSTSRSLVGPPMVLNHRVWMYLVLNSRRPVHHTTSCAWLGMGKSFIRITLVSTPLFLYCATLCHACQRCWRPPCSCASGWWTMPKLLHTLLDEWKTSRRNWSGKAWNRLHTDRSKSHKYTPVLGFMARRAPQRIPKMRLDIKW